MCSILSFSLHILFSLINRSPPSSSFFFFNDTATTEIYTLSLHDALPILKRALVACYTLYDRPGLLSYKKSHSLCEDRKSTRLNSSHLVISYAVFCLKKKKNKNYSC